MFKSPRRIFFLLILLAGLLVAVDLPENYRLKFSVAKFSVDRVINPLALNINLPWLRFTREFKTHLGLDLSGGTHMVLEADMKEIPVADRADALESSRQVIERRVNFFGVSEPVVQSSRTPDSYRIIVELPGITDVDRAQSLIGQTAKLEFREFTDEKEATVSAFVFPTLENTRPVGLTGKELRRAQITYSSQTGAPEVALEFNSDGAKIFGVVTGRLVGKRLAIFLDESPLTWPTVNTAITDGQAVITGGFTVEQARTLALQLNAGALPVAVRVIEKRTVGATLGAESVAKSIRAGLVGLGIVALFMIANYGRLGLLADLALILYGLLTFAIFRLIPITLTLPGVAGFLLSIGMAVDSNILIFERYREERRSGKPWAVAMELAFGKAWDSIRDANVTTLLTCVILFNPGNWEILPTSGMVRGFAVTLFIGVMMSLFTGIVATRTFMRVLYRER